VEALEAVLTERGLDGVGVNRIAEKAGVSKVLIYRYFGGVEGLLKHYVQMGKLFPVFSPEVLDRLRPVQEPDLARAWYRQVIPLYRLFRSSKAAREVLKSTIVEQDAIAEVTSKAVDEEMTRLVEQLTFVRGADSKALSAVILGGLSYLTMQAQLNRPVIGLNLRTETEWVRIEGAVKLLYMALGNMAVVSNGVTIEVQAASHPVGQWQ
jgi:AcrR family transcriptional regulator